MGGRLCPWSRCLTWAKPAKQPPCQGRSPGCKSGQRGQTRGQETAGQGRSTGATCPLKQTTSYTFPLRTSFVCLSFLSPLCPPCQQSISKHFCRLPSTFSSSLFLRVFLLRSSRVNKHTIYSLSHIPQTHPPSTPHSICPFGLPLSLIINPLHPHSLSSCQEGKCGAVCSRF